MASAKKTSSNSKSSSPSSKKTKLGSPMKKKSSSSQKSNSPKKSQSNSPKKSNKKSNNRQTGTSSKHPGYQQMVTAALTTFNARGGSSRAKILNYIISNYGLEHGKSVNTHLRSALEALVEEKVVSLAKGTGYHNGYYRITKAKKSNKQGSSSPKKKSTKIIINIITKSKWWSSS